ncbi:MAG TPA: prolyl oligopeptidase family serine peptidase, partial [Chryseosolibacter sp.]|nr:prolyl oligopeptidase family serine peptidase [Chryseosolibacter sp.]
MRLKLFFALAVVSGLSFSQLKAQQTAKITSSGIGFLEYLPDGYKTNNNDYPIVIFLHGIGEKGTTSTDPTTLLNSVWKVANVGLPKYIKYGAKYPFLMIAPQLKSSYGLWPANYVMDVLNYVKKYLRIDERRIYITGLSLGGYGTWTTLGAYPEVFAASVPICSGGNVLSKACAIAAENIPIWAFHGTADDVVSYTVTTKMIDAINACTPKPNPLAKYTLFSGVNHNAWDKTYKETNALTWMLSFTNGSSTPTTTTNVAPVANAGA